MYKFFNIFISIFCYQSKETHLNPGSYNLRINHLKNPLGIDAKGNLFSFLTEEKGSFKASLLLDNKTIDTKEIKLNQTYSSFLKNL